MAAPRTPRGRLPSWGRPPHAAPRPPRDLPPIELVPGTPAHWDALRARWGDCADRINLAILYLIAMVATAVICGVIIPAWTDHIYGVVR